MKPSNTISEEILTTINDLVKLRTTEAAFKEFERAVKYCEDFFANSNVVIKKFNYNNHPALIFLTRETTRPTFMLQGHLDVVEGATAQFHPRIIDNWLFGRGTVDMKGFDAVALHLLRDLSIENPEINMGLMLTFDEEVGSSNGAEQLAKEGYLPQVLINGDGGYNHAVIHAEKGILKFKLQVQTKPGRHPYPWDGENAFSQLMEDWASITQLFTSHNIATDSDNWYTTYSAYDVKVENEASFAPHYAEMKVNIYFTENASCDQLISTIKDEVRFATVETFVRSERVFLDADNLFIKQLQSIMEKHFEKPIEIRSENGSSDARFFTNKGIPIVIVKMVGEDHHGPNERLHIPSILPMYYSLKEYITSYSSLKPKQEKEMYNV